MLKSFPENKVRRLMSGLLMARVSLKSLRLKMILKGELESFCTWERIMKTSLMHSMSIKSLKNILTSSTSPSQSMAKVSTSWKPFGPERKDKSHKKSTWISTNSCLAPLITSTSYISNLMSPWPSKLLFTFQELMMKSSAFNLKRVVSVFTPKKYWSRKTVKKFFSPTFWDSWEVSLTVKTFHWTFQDKVIRILNLWQS